MSFITQLEIIMKLRALEPIVKTLGFTPRRITESELLECLQKGKTSFKGKAFARISLKNYLHIDIRGADISRLEDLAFVLRHFDCTGCILRGVNLAGEDLTNARLAKADLRRSNLATANLSGANLNKACLEDCNLAYAIFNHTNMQQASIKRANLFEATSIGGNFKNALFAGANTTRFFIDGSQYLPEKPANRASLTKLQLAIAVCGVLAIVFLTSRVVPPPVSSDGVQPSPSPPPSALRPQS